MKKIININLSGRVVPIEDSAYESLQKYIESLRRYFANEDGRDEIINDIESRIAELMNDKIKKGAAAITDEDINEIINSMGRVEDFEMADAEEKTATAAGTTTTTYTTTGEKRFKGRLYRDANDKFLGGVCSGIANYMNVDPAIVRLLFAIVTIGGFGMGFLVYILLWIILPLRNLDTYVGKRLFRNPDDKVFSGVAGGLAAYFDKPAWLIRVIFAAPLLLNIVFGTINRMSFYDHDIFPNIFIGSFTGTFVLAYIILWIVLPEAKSPFEKMEMRGEKVDVNRIRQNVKDEMENFKTQAQAWGEEVKTTAQDLGNRAKEFANTRGKAFAAEVTENARPIGTSIGHAIGVIFKAFFIFVAGCIALALFVALMVIIFGGVAWWPINNYLWSSTLQKMLAWSTLLLFIGVPVIGLMTWLVRRIVNVRSRNRYLGWTFGGLWTIGIFCAIFLAASIANDVRVYDKSASDIQLPQPPNNRLVVRVVEPEVRYSGNMWWMHNDNAGWDMTEDTMKYNNVKIRVEKSDDSSYHATIAKYSAGSSRADAQSRASKTGFTIYAQDSTLNLGSGLTIDRRAKFRGQGVIVTIQVPVGKKIRFDESLADAYNPWVVRRYDRDFGRNWGRHNRYDIDWDEDENIDWTRDVDYVMTSDGKLVEVSKAVNNAKGVYEKRTNADSLRHSIEEKEKQLEKDRNKLHQIESQRDENQGTTLYNQKPKPTIIISKLDLPYFSVLI